MNIPAGLRYTKEHEWAKADGDLVVVGITDHAQHQLGDIVFVELPGVGTTINAEQTFGTVESVKAVSDLFAPIAGEVVEVNSELTSQPELVNRDPYGAAWMVKIRPQAADALAGLLDATAYSKLVESAG